MPRGCAQLALFRRAGIGIASPPPRPIARTISAATRQSRPDSTNASDGEASGAGQPRGQLEAVLDMIAATASHAKWRGCTFLNTATEFPEPDHPARGIILASKRAVRERRRTLAIAANARDPELLAQHLQLLIDGAYAIGQSLGPDGPAKTMASAGRALIAAQVER